STATPPAGADLASPPVRVRTDGSGQYTAQRLAPGPVACVAKARGHGPARHSLTLAPGQSLPFDPVLPPGGRIVGRVTRDGSPVADVRVRVGPADAFATCRTESGADGAFTLVDVAAGSVTVEADSGQGAAARHARTVVDVPAGGEAACELELTPPGPAPNLRGRVVDATGKPVAGCRVSTRMAQAKNVATTTSADGTFAFAIPSGPVDLRVHRPGRPQPAFADLVVRAIDPAAGPVQLVLVPFTPARITGRIADAHGSGLPGTIACWHHERAEWVQFRAAADGSFGLGDVPPGTLDLLVEHPGLASVPVRELRLAAGELEDLGTLSLGSGGTLFGAVRGPGGMAPEQCDLTAVADGRRFHAEYRGGTYRFPTIPAGDYTLLVSGAGLAAVAFPISIVADTEKMQDVELQTGVRREIRVVLPPDAGSSCGLALRVAGSTMRWLDTGGTTQKPGVETEVTFVAWMAPGTYEAVAWTATGFEARQGIVFAAGDDREVRLTVARK
ncbi:MAG: carboxypeptidase regulatory-like domain-containing protein, partial [Planctomycetes bacterium]|nr:carboxypeptidase regulatory-like domain-containing protein [Planctomycetota bacterium]